MTNIENVKILQEANKAYATLLSTAQVIDNRFLYNKLMNDRHYVCESIDRYYAENKASMYDNPQS